MTLDVAHAHYAGGGPGSALVRLRGHAHAQAPSRLAPPTLLIADGAAWRRLAPVVGTPLLDADPAGVPFDVAFDVPLHLALGDGDWFLEPGPLVAGSSPAPARLDELAARVAALGAELAALRARVTAGEEGDATPARAPSAAGEAPSAGDVASAAPAPTAVPVPRATRLRALRPGLPALLFAAGAIAAGDAVATVAWQEPVSALWATHQQHALDGDLQRLDAAYAAPSAIAAARLPTASATAQPVSAQARMRALAATLDRRTTAGRPLGELKIARLHARYVVVQGTRASSLRAGPGHYAGTALPGQPGTVGIAGHRTTYGAPFRHLDALRRGDAITVTMPYGRFVYRVRGLRIVTPQDVSVLQAAAGRPRLTLTACHPLYSAAKRLVVIAELERAGPRGAAATTI
jgi:sortase A